MHGVRRKISKALRLRGSKRRMKQYRTIAISCALLFVFRGVAKGILLYALEHPEAVTKFAILLRVLYTAVTILSPSRLRMVGLESRYVYTPPVTQHFMFE
eukprot:CAMPEP_0196819926 /NCGR_PEP_ID=MMETSP1362-20130617/72907_1 /TAXON_ID=163516 /ORGANISM="Leptocylindrus danicus, Strain CCMP1856" /LENGTH=99 /DNA_ID=CAMNT_0042198589 /DNA_START=1 /DNA_END=297 /DNA_ORIENTATION=+